jgi:hypothetical protein
MPEEAEMDQYGGITINRANPKKFAENQLQYHFFYQAARTKSPEIESEDLVRSQCLAT